MKPRVIGFFAFLLAAGPIAALSSTAEIDKFNSVNDHVATGGQPTAPQIASLAREGFHGIVNLREPSEYDAAAEEAAAKGHGLIYVNIPVNRENPKPEQVDAFLKTLENRRIFPVFIHCGTANRVAAFWMIRRVLVDKWDLEDAEREAKLVGLKTPVMRDFAVDYVRSHPATR